MRKGIIHQVADLAREKFGDRDVVYHWILHGNPDELGGHTPIELIWTGHGEDVISYLRSTPVAGAAAMSPVAD